MVRITGSHYSKPHDLFCLTKKELSYIYTWKSTNAIWITGLFWDQHYLLKSRLLTSFSQDDQANYLPHILKCLCRFLQSFVFSRSQKHQVFSNLRRNEWRVVIIALTLVSPPKASTLSFSCTPSSKSCASPSHLFNSSSFTWTNPFVWLHFDNQAYRRVTKRYWEHEVMSHQHLDASLKQNKSSKLGLCYRDFFQVSVRKYK